MGQTLGHPYNLSVEKLQGPSVLPQDVAQVNEENLPVYNRCALYALGAAYLNLISQLTTVPAFCQHIREVGVLTPRRAREALGFGFPQNNLSFIAWAPCLVQALRKG